ncbi:hypothetical protein DFP73DRAFT_614711 [Morchella snyderi]|nr:hypothetical protein DFP73DRAFT_614711 [Morchella snyderi]
MPFPFTLPTTSPISYPTFFTSPVYPSLPLLASSHRGILRNALKAHKRLPPASQAANIPHIITLLTRYTAHLLTLTTALEENTAFLLPTAPQFTTSWRATLTPHHRLAKEPPRLARNGLSYEIFWTLSTLAYAHTLLALTQLRQVLAPPAAAAAASSSSAPADPQQLFNLASANLLTAASVYAHLLTRSRPPSAETWPAELTPPALAALSSVNVADATLVAVIKQDPYPTYVALTTTGGDAGRKEKKRRGEAAAAASREWLYSPPAPPTSVRALLLARLCVAASDHAGRALGLLGAEAVAGEFRAYVDALQRVARAKACRFLGIDAEGAGRCGEGIAWVVLAREVLSGAAAGGSGGGGGAGKGVWGMDAGRAEEEMVCAALEKRWRKVNDSVMFQLVPGTAAVAARMPTGREIHSVGVWEAPKLGAEEMRALRMESAVGMGAEGVEEDSGEEEEPAKAEYAGKGGYY